MDHRSPRSDRLFEEVLDPLMKAGSLLHISEDHFRPINRRSRCNGPGPAGCRSTELVGSLPLLDGQFGFDLDGQRVLRLVGREIADQFVQAFIKKDLKSTLPSSSAFLSSWDYRAAL